MKFQIRPADTPDTGAVHSLISQVYAEYGCVLDVERDERHLIDPGQYFRARGGQFWVVESPGGIVATGAVLIHPDSAELKTLYVHPTARRKGLARLLILRAIVHALRSGRTRMTLWSDTRFISAHRLYESLGFQRTGYRELSDLNSSREYAYEKQIGEADSAAANVPEEPSP